MKKILISALLSLFVSGALAQGSGNNIVLTDPPSHPRLIWLKSDEARVKKAIETDVIFGRMHRQIISDCNKMLGEEPVEHFMEGRRMRSVSSVARRRIFYLSYAWRITGDERYARRAEQEILAICGFKDWNPSHYLDVAESTTSVAIGYDWLYDWLPQSSKDVMVGAIVNKGLKTSIEEDGKPSKYCWWLSSDINWNQVCNTGLSLGALTTWENNTDLSKRIISRAVETIKLPMGAFAPDGAYPEGYGYWNYGTSYNVMFISAMEAAFGTDFGLTAMPGFTQSAYFMLNMVGAKYLAFNYSDGGDLSMPPPMFWFASRLGDGALLLAESGKIKKYGSKVLTDRILPLAIIWGAGFDCSKLAEPESRLWYGRGQTPVALMRSGWDFNKDIFLGFKCGTPSASHAHMDVGSFILDMNGQRWAMDLGGQKYHSLESKGLKIWVDGQNSDRWKVFRLNSLSHNLMSFSDSLQRIGGGADITSAGERPGFIFATTDVTSLNEGVIKSHKRGVAIVGDSYAIVRDEVESIGRANSAQWQIVTKAEVKITGKNTAELKIGEKTVTMTVIGPKVNMQTWSAQPDTDYDDRNKGVTRVGFTSSLAPGQKAAYTVFFTPEGVKADKKPVKDLKDWK